jgi:hypothetical protein
MHRYWHFWVALVLMVLSVVTYLVGAHLWASYDEVGPGWILFVGAAVMQGASLSLLSRMDYLRRKADTVGRHSGG